MASHPVSRIRTTWYKWKALRLPWRRRFLIGFDLHKNTFWEFRDSLSTHKMRRIVQYPRSTHYSDIDISPQWHQWLRHTRQDPPSLTEQSQDIVRQENLKILVAQADARWAARPSMLESPGKEARQPLPGTKSRHPEVYSNPIKSHKEEGKRGVILEELESEDQITNITWAKKTTAKDGREKQVSQATSPTHERQRHRKRNNNQNGDIRKPARGGPSEGWQPEAWDGNSGAK